MSYICIIFITFIGIILCSEFKKIDILESKFLEEYSDTTFLDVDESKDYKLTFDEIVTTKKLKYL
jgi:hypothetical protein